MKRSIAVLMMALMLAGCDSQTVPSEAVENPIDVGSNDTQINVPVQTENVPMQEEIVPEDDSVIDIDLTELSSTVSWAALNNILSDPESYVGQTIKMSGYFACIADDPEKIYCACLVKDAPGCCTAGIELDLPADWVYPDDYPAVDQDITVVGTFDIYEEDNMYYWTLRNVRFL